MAEFLTTTGISERLEQIIKNAKEKLFLISPYLKVNDRIKGFIEDKDRDFHNYRGGFDLKKIIGRSEKNPKKNLFL